MLSKVWIEIDYLFPRLNLKMDISPILYNECEYFAMLELKEDRRL